MKKLGRPKKNNKEDNVFVSMKMPKGLAESINKDAGRHFRMRTQHILWILTDYITKVSKEKLKNNNQPLYTDEELSAMYKEYKGE